MNLTSGGGNWLVVRNVVAKNREEGGKHSIGDTKKGKLIQQQPCLSQLDRAQSVLTGNVSLQGTQTTANVTAADYCALMPVPLIGYHFYFTTLKCTDDESQPIELVV